MLGTTIKKLRKDIGITQMVLAKALNVSKSTIAMWETNCREPDLDTIKKIAEFFGVSVDYLTGNKITVDYSGIDETKEFCLKHYPLYSQKIEGLLDDLDRLSDKGIDEACKRVHELTLLDEYSAEYIPTSEELSEINRLVEKSDYTMNIAAATGEEGMTDAKIREVNEFAEQIRKMENGSE